MSLNTSQLIKQAYDDPQTPPPVGLTWDAEFTAKESLKRMQFKMVNDLKDQAYNMLSQKSSQSIAKAVRSSLQKMGRYRKQLKVLRRGDESSEERRIKIVQQSSDEEEHEHQKRCSSPSKMTKAELVDAYRHLQRKLKQKDQTYSAILKMNDTIRKQYLNNSLTLKKVQNELEQKCEEFQLQSEELFCQKLDNEKYVEQTKITSEKTEKEFKFTIRLLQEECAKLKLQKTQETESLKRYMMEKLTLSQKLKVCEEEKFSLEQNLER